jgi:hypothetical protein
VFAQLHGERADGIIEVYRWDTFVKAYHTLFANAQPDPTVLIYSKSRRPSDRMASARALQEYLDDHMAEAAPVSPARRLSAAEAAAARRAELLQKKVWFTERQLYERFFSKRGPAARRARLANGLSRSVLRALNDSEYLYPAFQFDGTTGQVSLELERVLRMLPQDSSGWSGIFWFFQPHALLDGDCPANIWQQDPRIVAEAARSSFASEDTYW